MSILLQIGSLCPANLILKVFHNFSQLSTHCLLKTIESRFRLRLFEKQQQSSRDNKHKIAEAKIFLIPKNDTTDTFKMECYTTH